MNDKVIARQPAELEATPSLPPALKLVHQLDPDLAMRALAIMAARPEDTPLTPDRAIAAALHERKTGQVCGRDFYADQVMGLVPGYRGIAREAKENGAGLWQDSYRPFTDEEKAEHGIGQGDFAAVCELTQYAALKAAREAGIKYRPRIGFGIVKAAELKNRQGYEIKLKGGYTWTRKARNRALKDALRHAGLGDSAADILEDAGIEASDEVRARATVEQATQQVRLAKFQADQDARPEEVKAAEAAARAAHQRRASYDKAMGLAERCPDCGADLPDHTDGCQWFDMAPRYGDIEDIPGHAEEQGEVEPLTPPGRIRQQLRKAAEEVGGEPSERDRTWAVASLSKVFPAEATRHAVCAWLFGQESTKAMSRGELIAIKNWIGVTKVRNPDIADPSAKNAWEWIPSEQGVSDARIILAEILPQDQPQEVTP